MVRSLREGQFRLAVRLGKESNPKFRIRDVPALLFDWVPVTLD